ncbi:MAG: glycine betaine ABC transporter substrate-binding protein [Planctomycetota bacterium]
MTRSVSFVIAMVSMLVVSGCGDGKNRVVVGSKQFTEQKVLGEMVCQLIEINTDFRVDRRLGLQGTKVAFAAIREGDIDIYPEYTGTALINILERDYDRDMDRDQIYDLVKREWSEQWSLRWLDPLGFDNTYAYAMRDQHAAELDITKISELEPHADAIQAGFCHEYTTRPEYKKFEDVYGFMFDNVTKLDPDLTYRALQEGQVDIIDAFSSDGRIQAYDFRVLRDDKELFPPYDAAFVIRQDLADRHPEILEQLKKLSGKISATEMRKMNYDVSENLKAPATVAAAFLRREGLIE